jgi:hypothetical protein
MLLALECLTGHVDGIRTTHLWQTLWKIYKRWGKIDQQLSRLLQHWWLRNDSSPRLTVRTRRRRRLYRMAWVVRWLVNNSERKIHGLIFVSSRGFSYRNTGESWKVSVSISCELAWVGSENLLFTSRIATQGCLHCDSLYAEYIYKGRIM